MNRDISLLIFEIVFAIVYMILVFFVCYACCGVAVGDTFNYVEITDEEYYKYEAKGYGGSRD
jgi:ABC-type multidrug transport system permease subunit